jgi:predicted HTH transcriptional regulator
MAAVIREAYEKLSAGRPSEETKVVLPVDMLVDAGEGELIEFKSTLRVNLHTGQKDSRVELAVVKTIAGFLNTTGGTLVVGVSDDGVPVGLGPDGFPNEDRINLYLVDLLKNRIGAPTMLYVHPRFEDYQEERVLVVECQRSKSPVFAKDGEVERFYIRTGAATSELTASQIQQFIKQRFAA